jgi:hypothetical protein
MSLGFDRLPVDQRIKHDWCVKVEDGALSPKFMECRNCLKQVKWWNWRGEVELINPFQEGDDHTFCAEKEIKKNGQS